jgi:hypothetical protein
MDPCSFDAFNRKVLVPAAMASLLLPLSIVTPMGCSRAGRKMWGSGGGSERERVRKDGGTGVA